MGKWRGRMTKKRMARLMAEGLMTEQESLEYKADLMLDSARVSGAEKGRLRRAKVLAMDALTDEQVREKMRYTVADIEALNSTIHSPGRHAQAVQGGLKLKAMVNGLLEKDFGGAGAVNVVVNTISPYRPDPEVTSATAAGALPGKDETT